MRHRNQHHSSCLVLTIGLKIYSGPSRRSQERPRADGRAYEGTRAACRPTICTKLQGPQAPIWRSVPFNRSSLYQEFEASKLFELTGVLRDASSPPAAGLRERHGCRRGRRPGPAGANRPGAVAACSAGASCALRCCREHARLHDGQRDPSLPPRRGSVPPRPTVTAWSDSAHSQPWPHWGMPPGTAGPAPRCLPRPDGAGFLRASSADAASVRTIAGAILADRPGPAR